MIQFLTVLIWLFIIPFAIVTAHGKIVGLSWSQAALRGLQWPLLAYVVFKHLTDKNK